MKKKLLMTIVVAAILSSLLPTAYLTAFAIGDRNGATISAGPYNTMAIKEDSTLWAWGENYGGFLGDGTDTNRLTPVKVMDDVVSVSAGDMYTMAIKTDGTLWAWGENYGGFLVDDTEINRLTPVKIMDNVMSVSTGVMYTMAVKTDGTLWAWGNNGGGLLGDGTTTNRLTPVKITDNVASVSAGSTHAIAIKTDNSLWAWGYSEAGQLGDGSGGVYGSYSASPTKIMDDVSFASAGFKYTMAIKTDGTLWAWGWNEDGQLGDGSGGSYGSYKSTPVKIMDNVSYVSAGHWHTMAVKKDGTLWAWGNNYSGELGDGTTESRSTPVKILDSTVSVSLGYYHSVAVKTDGTLWTWGNNMNGQLGDGTESVYEQGVYITDAKLMVNHNKTTPTKVMDNVKLPNVGAAVNLSAKPTSSAVLVNGNSVSFDAYNINDNNYFKLRDLAYILSGTESQFEITWDEAKNAIILTTGKPYTSVGGEMSAKGGASKTPIAASAKVFLDGKGLSLTAYNIEGNNYFKLRDVGSALGFGVDWDGGSNTVLIDTSVVNSTVGYSAETPGEAVENLLFGIAERNVDKVAAVISPYTMREMGASSSSELKEILGLSMQQDDGASIERMTILSEVEKNSNDKVFVSISRSNSYMEEYLDGYGEAQDNVTAFAEVEYSLERKGEAFAEDGRFVCCKIGDYWYVVTF